MRRNHDHEVFHRNCNLGRPRLSPCLVVMTARLEHDAHGPGIELLLQKIRGKLINRLRIRDSHHRSAGNDSGHPDRTLAHFLDDDMTG